MSEPFDPNQPGQQQGQNPPPPWANEPASPPPWANEPTPPPWAGQPGGGSTPAGGLESRPWVARHKILTGLAVLVAVGIIGAAVGGGEDPQQVTHAAATETQDTTKGTALDPSYTTPSPAPAAPEVSETTPPAVEDYTPTVKDFAIALKIKSKECFGSAGCNVTYEPKLTIVGPKVDEDGTYEITFEVRGGDDGAAIDTIEVDGGQYSASEGLAQTARQSSKLTAVITEMEVG